MSVAALARFLVGRDLVFRASQDRAGSHSSDADPRSPGSAAETGGSETPSPTLDAVDLRPTGTDADVLAHR
jgi:hypothetical protein